MKFGLQKISVKLLAFNILVLSLPMISLLYIDTYEKQLLKSQENSMIQQGRVFGAALTGAADLEEESLRILTNLRQRVDSRIRIVDERGKLLADSSLPAVPQTADDSSWAKSIRYDPGVSAEDTFLYRIAVYPINTIKNLLLPPAPELEEGEYYSGKTVLDGAEVMTALSGYYGAATRFSSGGQRSINLYSAIPVYSDTNETEIIGAVLVSRSTFQILNYLYELRLDIIRIFLIFLILSIVISFALAMSITIPIVRLKNEAGNILDDAGNFRNHFTGFKRGDEIGELSRSLTRLSSNLEKKMDFIDRFTSDMLHELKNPMSAIKASAELAAHSTTDASELLSNIIEEEKRMERMLAELREISSLENLADNEKKEMVNISDVLPVILSRYDDVDFYDNTGGTAMLMINVDRLVQLVTNPVDNALSFSPGGDRVSVSLFEDNAGGIGFFRIEIDDSGPGLSLGEEEQVFNRFYSNRSDEERRGHSGLGLAIVKSITDLYGGSCSIENRESGGCRFTLCLLRSGRD